MSGDTSVGKKTDIKCFVNLLKITVYQEKGL